MKSAESLLRKACTPVLKTVQFNEPKGVTNTQNKNLLISSASAPVGTHTGGVNVPSLRRVEFHRAPGPLKLSMYSVNTNSSVEDPVSKAERSL